MDTKSFVKILRKVVREEVQKAVKQILNENINLGNQVTNHGMNLTEIAENPMPRRPYAKKKTFSKNSMLNDILNETAATGDFASMMEGPKVGMMDDYPSMGTMKTTQAVAPKHQPMTGIDGETVRAATPELAAVQNALNRDYSSMIKAIDKKNGKMGTIK